MMGNSHMNTDTFTEIPQGFQPEHLQKWILQDNTVLCAAAVPSISISWDAF